MTDAAEALSIAGLMLTELTGANYELSGHLADQMSGIMDNEQGWSKAAGLLTAATGALAGLSLTIMPITSGVMSGSLKNLGSELVGNLNYVQGALRITSGVTGVGSAVANLGLSRDKSRISSLQTKTQGYTSTGSTALQAGQALQRATQELIYDKGQAQMMMPVAR